MGRKLLLFLGAAGLLASVLWMLLSRSSTGPFLILAGISAVALLEGFYRK